MGQQDLPFPKTSKIETVKTRGLNEVARLVYSDGLTINTVVSSKTLQSFYQKLNFAKVSYQSVNGTLEQQYHSIVAKIKSMVDSRDKQQLVSLSFDKWTSLDRKKYIGVYLHINQMNICLGLVEYHGFCGSEEIAAHLKYLVFCLATFYCAQLIVEHMYNRLPTL